MLLSLFMLMDMAGGEVASGQVVSPPVDIFVETIEGGSRDIEHKERLLREDDEVLAIIKCFIECQ